MRTYARGRRYTGSRRWTALLLIAVGITGWQVGRMSAVSQPSQVTLPVYRHDLGVTVEMDLEDYVKGVVAAEMPAAFHLEALKAQAVAARTLALRLLEEQVPLPHQPSAIVSTDPATHQAWHSQEKLREIWGGLSYYWHWSKVSRAVASTRGLVMVYDGALIYPAYHSSSGGRTEDSENYWSAREPYLRSVDDPYVSGTAYEETSVTYPIAQIATAANVAAPASTSVPFIEIVERFPSGRVKAVRVGERTMTGRQLRETLGLRSNWFDVEVTGPDVRFTVRGYGHGVGMSQYGADGMAKAGHSFDQILAHYYTGVELISWYE